LQACIAHILTFFISLIRPLQSNPPPTVRDPEVSVNWLTNVLRSNNFIDKDARVESLEVVPFDAAGFTGVMKRIKVVYGDEKSNRTAPRTLVTKTSRPTLTSRYRVITNCFYREAYFYSCTQLSKKVITPPIIYSCGSILLGEYVVISEDVTFHKNFTKVGPIFGNQIWPVPNPPSNDPVATMKNIYLDAANFHAHFWKSESLFKYKWLRDALIYSNRGRAHWEICIEKGRSSWRIVKDKMKKGTLGFEISPKLANIIEKSFAKASWNGLQERLRDKRIPWTLSHGDFHAGNMIIANDTIFMVDWSQCGIWEPTSDLAQTIISDVKPAIFLKHSKEWVRAYWERLCTKGISPDEYPFSQCWDSYCKAGPEKWIFIFTVMATMAACPVEFSKYFHDQLLAFIEGHGDFDCYDVQALWMS